jgi:phage shock protein A
LESKADILERITLLEQGERDVRKDTREIIETLASLKIGLKDLRLSMDELDAKLSEVKGQVNLLDARDVG